MRFWRVYTAIFCAVLGVSVNHAWSYSGGVGTPQDPYQIATPEDLVQLGNTFDEYGLCYVLTQDLDLSNYHFSQAVVARAIWPAQYQVERDAFTGSFDGQGHVVRNMSIQGQGWLGLFGGLAPSGVVCNVNLELASVTSAGDQSGALVGVNEGLVLNCSVQGQVHGQALVGGLIGLNRGAVINSYSHSVVSGLGGIGGLVGTNEHGMLQCVYSLGSVSGSEHAGGLVGRNWGGTISDAYSAAAVAEQSSAGGLVGDNPGPGEGYPEGTVISSFWDTEASGLAQSAAGVGLTTPDFASLDIFLSAGWDFAGEYDNGTCDTWSMPDPNGYPQLQWFLETPWYLPGDGSAESPYSISSAADLGRIMYSPAAHYRLNDSVDLAGILWKRSVIPYFTGVLDGDQHEVQGLTAADAAYMGLFGTLGSDANVSNLAVTDVNIIGLAGSTGALAANNRGTVTGCYSSGVIRGGDQVGGLVGSNEGLVQQSFSLGAVQGTHRIGGLVGENLHDIQTSYATGAVLGEGHGVGGLVGSSQGTILQCFATGTVTGVSSVAGLVGSQSAGQISQCYSTGLVKGATATGGLVGSSSGTVEASFWEIETSIKVVSAGGRGKYSAQMAEAQTFLDAGWDFFGDPLLGVAPVWYLSEVQPRPALTSTGQFTLFTESSAGGAVVGPNLGTSHYLYDTELTIEARPDAHHHFVGWSGSAVDQGWVTDPNAAASLLHVQGHGDLRATFAIDQHTITIGHSEHGRITVPDQLSGVYPYGRQIPLSAEANDNYRFLSWRIEGAVALDNVTAAHTTLTVQGDGAVFAQFVLQTKVQIPDSSLKAAIEAALGTQNVTVSGMKALARLELVDANVFDLTGLEYATNLTYLDLTGNYIREIDAIGMLRQLSTLGLGRNRIADCSALASLAELDRLFLNDNLISDVSALSSMTKLTQVNLNNNLVQDIQAFAQLPELEVAWLKNNQISSVSPLVGLERLGWLSLTGNPLDNVTSQEWFLLKQTVETQNLGTITHSPFTFVQ